MNCFGRASVSSLIAALLMALTASPLLAQEPVLLPRPAVPDAPRDADLSPRERAQQKRRERIWEMHWPRYAAKLQRFDGKHYYLPHVNGTNHNSLGLSEDQVRSSMTVEYVPQIARGINPVKKLTVSSPDEDMEVALRTLPAYRPGEFGYIASAQIIEDAEEYALANQVKLLDERELRSAMRTAERTVQREVERLPNLRTDPKKVLQFLFRNREKARELEEQIAEDDRPLLLRGFDERHGDVKPPPKAGREWRGPIQIAILSEEEGKLLAVPLHVLEAVETEEDFVAALAERGMDKEAFIDMFEEFAARRVSIRAVERRVSQLLAGLDDKAMEGIDLRQNFEELNTP